MLRNPSKRPLSVSRVKRHTLNLASRSSDAALPLALIPTQPVTPFRLDGFPSQCFVHIRHIRCLVYNFWRDLYNRKDVLHRAMGYYFVASRTCLIGFQSLLSIYFP